MLITVIAGERTKIEVNPPYPVLKVVRGENLVVSEDGDAFFCDLIGVDPMPTSIDFEIQGRELDVYDQRGQLSSTGAVLKTMTGTLSVQSRTELPTPSIS